jgi:hypothetical protein
VSEPIPSDPPRLPGFPAPDAPGSGASSWLAALPEGVPLGPLGLPAGVATDPLPEGVAAGVGAVVGTCVGTGVGTLVGLGVGFGVGFGVGCGVGAATVTEGGLTDVSVVVF